MAQKKIEESQTKIFQFPGSQTHYPSLFSFEINYMTLKIKPNFNKKNLVGCEQQLKIKVLQEIKEIKFDIAEMKIENVFCPSAAISKIDENQKEDRLVIEFQENLSKGSMIDLHITYSAGYYPKDGTSSIRTPRSGFYFIAEDRHGDDNNNNRAIQAWTQGEALESRYWFPCIDEPQLKFPREVHVIVPKEFIVISNGLGEYDKEKQEWIWREQNPTPAYLTSVVIGRFAKEEKDRHNGIQLEYYWPENVPKDHAMLTFGNTPDMMNFFGQYLRLEYPFKKYSQVAVDEFEFGGMENISATTLTKDILHDDKVVGEYKRDIQIVSHELAHQWFGDLITCKDWPHIWLNEGFATYFESLYIDKNHIRESNKFPISEEFYYYLMTQISDRYLNEARTLYKRPIVTNIYKHPDELFDRHSYNKGAYVLHMLRSYIGDDKFQSCLTNYLKTYRDKNAETDDLRHICETVSGISLYQFFDQWLYRKGHPELDIEFSLEQAESRKALLKVKITQIQEDSDYTPFVFPLEIRLVYTDDNNENKPKVIQISKKETESTYEISPEKKIRWISIDPEFKVLKEIKSLKITEEKEEYGLKLKDMLIEQLKYGKTILERIEAARGLKNYYSEEAVDSLKERILSNEFYGVGVESANTIGSYYDKSNHTKSKKGYEALKECLKDITSFYTLQPQVRQAIVRNIGLFEREDEDLLKILKDILEQDKSYYVKQAAATSIGKCSKKLSSNILKDPERGPIKLLKNIVDNMQSFQNVVAQGAIEGLKEFSKHTDIGIVTDIANFLIDRSKERNSNGQKNEYFVRRASTSALGKFLVTDTEQITKLLDNNNTEKIKKEAEEMNQRVFDNLNSLLKDKRRAVKINACTAFVDNDAKISNPTEKMASTIDELITVAEHDVDGFVRREAETSVNIIREWLKEWTDKPPKIDIKIRKEGKEEEKKKHLIVRKREEKNQQYQTMLDMRRTPVLEY